MIPTLRQGARHGPSRFPWPHAARQGARQLRLHSSHPPPQPRSRPRPRACSLPAARARAPPGLLSREAFPEAMRRAPLAWSFSSLGKVDAAWIAEMRESMAAGQCRGASAPAPPLGTCAGRRPRRVSMLPHC